MITYRQAQASDLAYVTWLHHETLRDYVTPIWGWDEAQQDEFVRNWFRPERVRIIKKDGEDIGLIVVSEHADQVFLESISINPDKQGNGYGRSVCQELLANAQDKKIPFRLQVLKTNSGARRFYESLGMKVWKETKHHFQMEVLN